MADNHGPAPGSRGLHAFVVALVGLAFAHLVTGSSDTIAKMLMLSRNEPFVPERIAEVALYVTALLVVAGAVFGIYAARRQWVSFEQVVTSLLFAAFVAFITIIDHSLPSANGSPVLPFWETVYYFVWIAGFWFAPIFLLPSYGDGLSARVRRGGGVLVVAAVMSFLGLASGLGLEEIVGKILDAKGWLEGSPYNSQNFWIAKPVTVNAIHGAFVTVAFASIWWRRIWASAASAIIWTASVSVLTVVYAGVYGGAFYADGRLVAWWHGFLVFAALPGVVAVTLYLAYAYTRRDVNLSVGWPVSSKFWLLLPLGFSAGFAGIALLGLQPIARDHSGVTVEASILVVSHGLNGIVLGSVLRLMPFVFRMIPIDESE